MEPTSRKAKRVVKDGPRVTVEWDDGEKELRVCDSHVEAIEIAATRAAELGTYVFDTAKQEALSFLQ